MSTTITAIICRFGWLILSFPVPPSLLHLRYPLRPAALDAATTATPRSGLFNADRLRQRGGGTTPRPNPSSAAAAAPAAGEFHVVDAGAAGGAAPHPYNRAGGAAAAFTGQYHYPSPPTLISQCFGCDAADETDPISRRAGAGGDTAPPPSLTFPSCKPSRHERANSCDCHLQNSPPSCSPRREIATFFRRMVNFVRIAKPREHWLIWCSLNFYICTVVTFWTLMPYQTPRDRVVSVYLYSWGARTDKRIWCGRRRDPPPGRLLLPGRSCMRPPPPLRRLNRSPSSSGAHRSHGESWRFVSSIFLHSGGAPAAKQEGGRQHKQKRRWWWEAQELRLLAPLPQKQRRILLPAVAHFASNMLTFLGSTWSLERRCAGGKARQQTSRPATGSALLWACLPRVCQRSLNAASSPAHHRWLLPGGGDAQQQVWVVPDPPAVRPFRHRRQPVLRHLGRMQRAGGGAAASQLLYCTRSSCKRR